MGREAAVVVLRSHVGTIGLEIASRAFLLGQPDVVIFTSLPRKRDIRTPNMAAPDMTHLRGSPEEWQRILQPFRRISNMCAFPFGAAVDLANRPAMR
jgi:hypothetical protein